MSSIYISGDGPDPDPDQERVKYKVQEPRDTGLDPVQNQDLPEVSVQNLKQDLAQDLSLTKGEDPLETQSHELDDQVSQGTVQNLAQHQAQDQVQDQEHDSLQEYIGDPVQESVNNPVPDTIHDFVQDQAKYHGQDGQDPVQDPEQDQVQDTFHGLVEETGEYHGRNMQDHIQNCVQDLEHDPVEEIFHILVEDPSNLGQKPIKNEVQDSYKIKEPAKEQVQDVVRDLVQDEDDYPVKDLDTDLVQDLVQGLTPDPEEDTDLTEVTSVNKLQELAQDSLMKKLSEVQEAMTQILDKDNDENQKGNQEETQDGNEEETQDGNQEETQDGYQEETQDGNQKETQDGNQEETQDGNQEETQEVNQEEDQTVNREKNKNENQKEIHDVVLNLDDQRKAENEFHHCQDLGLMNQETQLDPINIKKVTNQENINKLEKQISFQQQKMTEENSEILQNTYVEPSFPPNPDIMHAYTCLPETPGAGPTPDDDPTISNECDSVAKDLKSLCQGGISGSQERNQSSEFTVEDPNLLSLTDLRNTIESSEEKQPFCKKEPPYCKELPAEPSDQGTFFENSKVYQEETRIEPFSEFENDKSDKEEVVRTNSGSTNTSTETGDTGSTVIWNEKLKPSLGDSFSSIPSEDWNEDDSKLSETSSSSFNDMDDVPEHETSVDDSPDHSDGSIPEENNDSNDFSQDRKNGEINEGIDYFKDSAIQFTSEDLNLTFDEGGVDYELVLKSIPEELLDEVSEDSSEQEQENLQEQDTLLSYKEKRTEQGDDKNVEPDLTKKAETEMESPEQESKNFEQARENKEQEKEVQEQGRWGSEQNIENILDLESANLLRVEEEGKSTEIQEEYSERKHGNQEQEQEHDNILEQQQENSLKQDLNNSLKPEKAFDQEIEKSLELIQEKSLEQEQESIVEQDEMECSDQEQEMSSEHNQDDSSKQKQESIAEVEQIECSEKKQEQENNIVQKQVDSSEYEQEKRLEQEHEKIDKQELDKCLEKEQENNLDQEQVDFSDLEQENVESLEQKEEKILEQEQENNDELELEKSSEQDQKQSSKQDQEQSSKQKQENKVVQKPLEIIAKQELEKRSEQEQENSFEQELLECSERELGQNIEQEQENNVKQELQKSSEQDWEKSLKQEQENNMKQEQVECSDQEQERGLEPEQENIAEKELVVCSKPEQEKSLDQEQENIVEQETGNCLEPEQEMSPDQKPENIAEQEQAKIKNSLEEPEKHVYSSEKELETISIEQENLEQEQEKSGLDLKSEMGVEQKQQEMLDQKQERSFEQEYQKSKNSPTEMDKNEIKQKKSVSFEEEVECIGYINSDSSDDTNEEGLDQKVENELNKLVIKDEDLLEKGEVNDDLDDKAVDQRGSKHESEETDADSNDSENEVGKGKAKVDGFTGYHYDATDVKTCRTVKSDHQDKIVSEISDDNKYVFPEKEDFAYTLKDPEANWQILEASEQSTHKVINPEPSIHNSKLDLEDIYVKAEMNYDKKACDDTDHEAKNHLDNSIETMGIEDKHFQDEDFEELNEDNNALAKDHPDEKDDETEQNSFKNGLSTDAKATAHDHSPNKTNDSEADKTEKSENCIYFKVSSPDMDCKTDNSGVETQCFKPENPEPIDNIVYVDEESFKSNGLEVDVPDIRNIEEVTADIETNSDTPKNVLEAEISPVIKGAMKSVPTDPDLTIPVEIEQVKDLKDKNGKTKKSKFIPGHKRDRSVSINTKSNYNMISQEN